MVHQKLDHFTLIPALIALKSPRFARFPGKVKPLELGLRRPCLLYQFGCPHGSHDIEMLRNDQGGLQFSFKSLSDPLIRSHPSLKDDGGKDLLTAADVIQVIPDQRITETSHDICAGMAHLLFMDHVCLCKDRASASNPHRVIRL